MKQLKLFSNLAKKQRVDPPTPKIFLPEFRWFTEMTFLTSRKPEIQLKPSKSHPCKLHFVWQIYAHKISTTKNTKKKQTPWARGLLAARNYGQCPNYLARLIWGILLAPFLISLGLQRYMKMQRKSTCSVHIRALHRFQNLEPDRTGTGYIKTGPEPEPILNARTGPEPEPAVSEPDRNRNRSNFQN